jgi:hypothetical protein
MAAALAVLVYLFLASAHDNALVSTIMLAGFNMIPLPPPMAVVLP